MFDLKIQNFIEQQTDFVFNSVHKRRLTLITKEFIKYVFIFVTIYSYTRYLYAHNAIIQIRVTRFRTRRIETQLCKCLKCRKENLSIDVNGGKNGNDKRDPLKDAVPYGLQDM